MSNPDVDARMRANLLSVVADAYDSMVAEHGHCPSKFEITVMLDGSTLEVVTVEAYDGEVRQGRSVVYRGRRLSCGHVEVTRDGKPLPHRFDLRNHSPTSFEWGYGDSGPSQLALALLADALGDDALAQRLYQTFKFKVVACLDSHTDWEMTSESIRLWSETGQWPVDIAPQLTIGGGQSC